MNGPEHYAKAESLLAEAREVSEQLQGRVIMTHQEAAGIQSILAAQIAVAQVHATLALSAAQAAQMLPEGSKGRVPWLRLALGDPGAFTETQASEGPL